jgi:hypothetical protein
VVDTRRQGKGRGPELFPSAQDIAMEDDEDEARFFESEEAIFDIADALENASVDPRERRIVWADGSRLTIEETARRIGSTSEASLASIQSHVVGWLQMHYEPQGLDDTQMEEFEELIERWTAPYEYGD